MKGFARVGSGLARGSAFSRGWDPDGPGPRYESESQRSRYRVLQGSGSEELS